MILLSKEKIFLILIKNLLSKFFKDDINKKSSGQAEMGQKV